MFNMFITLVDIKLFGWIHLRRFPITCAFINYNYLNFQISRDFGNWILYAVPKIFCFASGLQIAGGFNFWRGLSP